MTTSRAQFDADRFDDPGSVSLTLTSQNPHEVACQYCNRPLFIDDETLASVNRQIERGLDEPAFTCDDCRTAEGEIAHS
ncbi:MAG TPA: hypothetical protein PKD24_16605 [Pyrinomonadaceae bacterium]|nr:hypothetical protein [Pyrinomonadaceae bacterium]HMP67021.1 hypothetical protein [Pyrinomonadaceae bacterium]